MFKNFLNLADGSAITLSMLCAIHCLFSPIILLALPTLTGFALFSDEQFHTWLLFAVIPISAIAVLLGFASHSSWNVIIITSIGLVVLLLVAILGHEILGDNGELIASVIGSAFVACGHIKNLRRRKISHQCLKVSTKRSA